MPARIFAARLRSRAIRYFLRFCCPVSFHYLLDLSILCDVSDDDVLGSFKIHQLYSAPICTSISTLIKETTAFCP